MTSVRLPMFPLGAVLFPHVPIPLRIFEPRYRALVKDCLSGTGEFGVVLIERGSEVGGGDVRSSLGTVARIAQAQEHPDGTWMLTAVGDRRLVVDEWLADDPYPLALVSDAVEGTGERFGDALAEADRAVKRALQLAASLAPGADPSFDSESLPFDTDPEIHLSQLCAVVPVTSYDRQSLLRCDELSERARVLAALAEEQILLLEARGGEPR